MHHKKRFLASILLVLLMVFLLSACSNNKPECKLSELNDDELNKYIADSEIAIPKSVDIDTIREMIIELENNPDHPAPVVGYTLIADLYEDIRNLVAEYEPSGLGGSKKPSSLVSRPSSKGGGFTGGTWVRSPTANAAGTPMKWIPVAALLRLPPSCAALAALGKSHAARDAVLLRHFRRNACD